MAFNRHAYGRNEYFLEKLHRVAVHNMSDLKNLFITLMEGAGIRFQSIRVNDSVESGYQ